MQLHVWHLAKLPDSFPKHLYQFPFLTALHENPVLDTESSLSPLAF